MIDLLLARAIAGYQRRLSPLKGFSCAHRVLHGGASCSDHAKRVVLRCGCGKFLPLMRRRFARCAEAARVLQTQDGGGRVLDYSGPPPLQEGRKGSVCKEWRAGCRKEFDGGCMGHSYGEILFGLAFRLGCAAAGCG